MKPKKRKKKLKIITSDDILGKEAVDPEGSILGVVTKVHIDKKNMKVTGITIDMGLLKPDLFVGSRYIRYFGIDAVLLNKIPHDKFKGLKVLTEGGELIGKVKNIVADKERIKEFVIASKKLWDGHYHVAYKDIKEIGDQIILKGEGNLKKKEK
jgi:sporulation protein YlmC with PRC-barrel domain